MLSMKRCFTTLHSRYVVVRCCNYFTDSVQRSLEQKFARHGGSIPVTPSESFEKRISVGFHSCLFHYIFNRMLLGISSCGTSFQKSIFVAVFLAKQLHTLRWNFISVLLVLPNY